MKCPSPSGCVSLQYNYTVQTTIPVILMTLYQHTALTWGAVCNLPAGIQGIIKRHGMDRRSLSILGTVSRGDTGCIVNGQQSIDPSDPIGGNKGITMKMYIGTSRVDVCGTCIGPAAA